MKRLSSFGCDRLGVTVASFSLPRDCRGNSSKHWICGSKPNILPSRHHSQLRFCHRRHAGKFVTAAHGERRHSWVPDVSQEADWAALSQLIWGQGNNTDAELKSAPLPKRDDGVPPSRTERQYVRASGLDSIGEPALYNVELPTFETTSGQQYLEELSGARRPEPPPPQAQPLPRGHQLLLDVWGDLMKAAEARWNGSAEESDMEYAGLMRLKYRLERAIWSNLSGQYMLLIITVTALAFSGGAMYSSVTGEELSESLWHAQLFVLDSGNISNETSLPARVVGLALTVMGLFLVSVLVGIVSQAIEQQVASVTSQVTRVLESDHIVVLNWNASAPRLVKELILGNLDTEGYKRNRTIAVLADVKQKMMAATCRELAAEYGSSDVLCIQGSPQLASSLELVSAVHARAIVILSSEDTATSQGEECDANAVCTMLSLSSAAAAVGVALPTVIMEVHSSETVGLVRRTFGDSVYPILVGSFAAKLTVQAILMPGISRVFKNLLSFQGSEFYFLPVPLPLVGAPYGRLFEIMEEAIPIGLQHETQLELLPSDRKRMAADDYIVLLQKTQRSGGLDAVSDASSRFQGKALERIMSSWEETQPAGSIAREVAEAVQRRAAAGQQRMDVLFSTLDQDNEMVLASPELAIHLPQQQLIHGAVLICGWRPGIGTVLKTLDRVMDFGSEVHMMASVPIEDRDAFLMADGLDLDHILNIKLMHFEGRPGIIRDLEQLPISRSGYTAVVLLANWQSEERHAKLSSADAVRMKSALILRDFLSNRMGRKDRGETTFYITEVSGAGADVTLPFSEFVEVGALDVLAISQVVFQPMLHNLQMQLLDTSKGVQLTLEPATVYCHAGESLSFKEMSERVHHGTRGLSLLIGYKMDVDVLLNPARHRPFPWEEHYELVVLNRKRGQKDEAVRRWHLESRLQRRRDRLLKALGPTWNTP